MSKFLEQVASYVNQQHGSALNRIAMVFPSRRAGIYFLKYLSALHETPSWSPVILTLSDVFATFSPLQPADQLTLVATLYKIYKEKTGSTETFDSFYYWGEMMLSDFDDLDKHLVDAGMLFRNISDIKDLEKDVSYLTEPQVEAIRIFWKNFESSRPSGEKENFSHLWQNLFPVYLEFRKTLASQGIGYEGMVFREVSEKIKTEGLDNLPWDRIYFTGFNVLNECERSLFRYFIKRQCAGFFWDYDEAYISDTTHEAGAFLRNNLMEFPSLLPRDEFRNLEKSNKKVRIISESSNTGQAITAGNILEKLAAQDIPLDENTAVVLADESLLMPLLYALPASAREINVTMGLPVTETPIYGFIESLVQLSHNARIIRNEPCYYHRDVMGLLKSKYVSGIDGTAKKLAESILTENRVFVPAGELRLNAELEMIFPVPDQLSDFSSYLRRLLENLYHKAESIKDASLADIAVLEKESIFRVYLNLQRLHHVMEEQQLSMQMTTYRALLRNLLRLQTINFSGEPLGGLQVMGILETRCLDFDHLIILSVNEDILPKSSQLHSFIPYALRKGFGMSLPERQDAMYSYYFYRLLQRSADVSLLYNSVSSGMQKGEMSRYLYQLKYASSHTVEEETGFHSIGTQLPKNIEIRKEGKILGKLREMHSGSASDRYLSPTAITTYIECSLKFCYRHLLNIRKQEEVTEEIDSMVFGNILHETIRQIYHPWQGTMVSSDILQELMKKGEMMNQIISDAIRKEMMPGRASSRDVLQGKNILMAEILHKLVLRILKTDAAIAPLEIVEMEKTSRLDIPLKAGNRTLSIKLGGKIDRMDKSDGRLRIIDYKTGGRESTAIDPNTLFDPSKISQNRATIQVLTYCFLQAGITGNSNIQPGLYYPRNMTGENYDPRILIKTGKDKVAIDSYEEVLGFFPDQLLQVAVSLFDEQVSFTQTPHEKSCQKCEFAAICHRD